MDASHPSLPLVRMIQSALILPELMLIKLAYQNMRLNFKCFMGYDATCRKSLLRKVTRCEFMSHMVHIGIHTSCDDSPNDQQTCGFLFRIFSVNSLIWKPGGIYVISYNVYTKLNSPMSLQIDAQEPYPNLLSNSRATPAANHWRKIKDLGIFSRLKWKSAQNVAFPA